LKIRDKNGYLGWVTRDARQAGGFEFLQVIIEGKKSLKGLRAQGLKLTTGLGRSSGLWQKSKTRVGE